MKFALDKARATKDVDFVLDVIALRAESLRSAEVLVGLGYTAVEGARNFQFEKDIPNSREKMRIEFLAPEEYKRRADFRGGCAARGARARVHRRHNCFSRVRHPSLDRAPS
jgi:hypothetical protein